ncbi:hypothetical protein J2S43_000508 [Catenuloplanes nepalensis]|uniref:Uncharacterized protein n=1 Tax=Catenuloplanes nepalensis TaxID=587533 RepID=A0ABT9MKR4_9ACTN|nr:hypothetical protein [Catenuloplanes nepalensis]MDP9791996.1 hypothetical protein [Catenuloplanes nepalensis]
MGVHIHGDNHGAAAAGDHAKAIVGERRAESLAPVVSAARRLHAAIDAVPEALPDPDAALRDVNAIAAATESDPPDTAAAMAAARRLLDRVTAAGAFASATEKLRAALRS